jgi:hypothetical protein
MNTNGREQKAYRRRPGGLEIRAAKENLSQSRDGATGEIPEALTTDYTEGHDFPNLGRTIPRKARKCHAGSAWKRHPAAGLR